MNIIDNYLEFPPSLSRPQPPSGAFEFDGITGSDDAGPQQPPVSGTPCGGEVLHSCLKMSRTKHPM